MYFKSRRHIKSCFLMGIMIGCVSPAFSQETPEHSKILFTVIPSTDPPGAYRGYMGNLSKKPVILYGYDLEDDDGSFFPEEIVVEKQQDDGSWQRVNEPAWLCGNAAIDEMLRRPQNYYTFASGTILKVPLIETYRRVIQAGSGRYRFTIYLLLSKDTRVWGREDELSLFPLISEPVEIVFPRKK